MDELVIKPGMRFLHAHFVESDLQTPQTMVVTSVRKSKVFFTSAELYDVGGQDSWCKNRETFESSVKEWL